jgi:AraC family transcriptional regulator of adaptative response/methylated-DNA-[protein]-cysteine methyltransferase
MTGLPSGLDWDVCDRARLARDPAFDGVFFTGVRTTRIYCRPVCPVRPARSANVLFFGSAAAAERAGFRPCLRCRPETAPGSPAWSGTATTVARGMRLIEEGFLDEASVAELADRLGVGPRHLLRLFLRHTGAPPSEIAATRRVQAAKRLIDQTTMGFVRHSLHRRVSQRAAVQRRIPSHIWPSALIVSRSDPAISTR